MDGDWKIPDPGQRPRQSGVHSRSGSSLRNTVVKPRRQFPIALAIFLVAVLLPILGTFGYIVLVPALKSLSRPAPAAQIAQTVWVTGEEAHAAFGKEWVSARTIPAAGLLAYGTKLWDLYEDAYASNNPESLHTYQENSKRLFSETFGLQGLVGIEIPLSIFAPKSRQEDPGKSVFLAAEGKREMPDGGEQSFEIKIVAPAKPRAFEELIDKNELMSGAKVRILLIPYYTDVSEERKNVRSIDLESTSRLGHMNKWITASTVTVEIQADFAGAQVVKNDLPLRSLMRVEKRFPAEKSASE